MGRGCEEQPTRGGMTVALARANNNTLTPHDSIIGIIRRAAPKETAVDNPM